MIVLVILVVLLLLFRLRHVLLHRFNAILFPEIEELQRLLTHLILLVDQHEVADVCVILLDLLNLLYNLVELSGQGIIEDLVLLAEVHALELGHTLDQRVEHVRNLVRLFIVTYDFLFDISQMGLLTADCREAILPLLDYVRVLLSHLASNMEEDRLALVVLDGLASTQRVFQVETVGLTLLSFTSIHHITNSEHVTEHGSQVLALLDFFESVLYLLNIFFESVHFRFGLQPELPHFESLLEVLLLQQSDEECFRLRPLGQVGLSGKRLHELIKTLLRPRTQQHVQFLKVELSLLLALTRLNDDGGGRESRNHNRHILRYVAREERLLRGLDDSSCGDGLLLDLGLEQFDYILHLVAFDFLDVQPDVVGLVLPILMQLLHHVVDDFVRGWSAIETVLVNDDSLPVERPQRLRSSQFGLARLVLYDLWRSHWCSWHGTQRWRHSWHARRWWEAAHTWRWRSTTHAGRRRRTAAHTRRSRRPTHWWWRHAWHSRWWWKSAH